MSQNVCVYLGGVVVLVIEFVVGGVDVIVFIELDGDSFFVVQQVFVEEYLYVYVVGIVVVWSCYFFLIMELLMFGFGWKCVFCVEVQFLQ